MISLVPINPNGTRSLCDELGKGADLRKSFPLMGRTSFQRNVVAAHEIHRREESVGFLMETKPAPPFRRYGEKETLIMIYPEFQRQGVGTQALSLICQETKPIFFVASKSNQAGTAFFKKQPSLALLDETDRYWVYSRA